VHPRCLLSSYVRNGETYLILATTGVAIRSPCLNSCLQVDLYSSFKTNLSHQEKETSLPIWCQHLNQMRQNFSSDQQESEVETGNQDNVQELDPEAHLFQVDESWQQVGWSFVSWLHLGTILMQTCHAHYKTGKEDHKLMGHWCLSLSSFSVGVAQYCMVTNLSQKSTKGIYEGCDSSVETPRLLTKDPPHRKYCFFV
jgi:hypothetical protein